MCQLVRPTGSTRIDRASLVHSHWACIDAETFKTVWDEEVAAAEGRLDVETIWVAMGLLLPVWNRLPQDDVRVWRIDNGAGTSILGRIIRPGAVEKLQAALDWNRA